MKITESHLRKIIRSIVKESFMKDKTISQSTINAPTSFQKAHEEGMVDDMTFYSTGPTDKHYPGHYYTKQQENEAKEISKMSIGDMQDRKINEWCNSNGLSIGDFIQCCKQIGC